MITATSLDAYRSIEDSKATLKAEVYETICKARHPSNKDIARMLGREINTITPRVNELVKDGAVRQGGIKKDPWTGRRCLWWEAVQ